MVDFFEGQGWTIIGPYLPKGFPALQIKLIAESGPKHMVKTWLPLGDPYWTQARRISVEKVEEVLSNTWGGIWKERVAKELLDFIADEFGDEIEWYLDSLDRIVSWSIERPPIMTVKEAEEVWNISGLRARIREGRFLDEECWQSGKTWMIRLWGMYRRYGWP